MLLVTDNEVLNTNDVYPGPRREAIVTVDQLIEVYEQTMNDALDAGDNQKAYAAAQELKGYRLERAGLFTCSIHEIDGVYDFDTGRGE